MTRNRPKPATSFSKRLLHRFLVQTKYLYHLYAGSKHNEKRILFIFGCQRSGTTLMTRVFDKDFNTKVYGEFIHMDSKASKRTIRLGSYPMLRQKLNNNLAPRIVLKPLVESQNCLNLLAFFEHSKGLWMFRDYRGVVQSNMRRFGTKQGIADLRPIAENTPDNWRSESVSHETRMTVINHFSEDMNPCDAAALFWFARNRLFFEQRLDLNPSVALCRYETLVSSPVETMMSIYKFLRWNYPGKRICSDMHSKSVKKGKTIQISPEISYLCDDLLDRLQSVYAACETFQP